MNSTKAQQFSLEDLQVFNAEILALVQAGVPIELGLRSIAEDSAGALQRLTSDVAERMERGASLAEALEACGDRIPRLYRDLVQAGLQANRLPTALEAVADLLEQLIEVRGRIGIALLYPLMVLSLGYVVFLMFVWMVVGVLQLALQDIVAPSYGLTEMLLALRNSWILWIWIPPLLISLAVIWWFRLGRSQMIDATNPLQGLNWLPGVSAVLRNHRRASFATLLAAMVDQKLALDRAVVLSANCIGGRKLQESARELATLIQQGPGPLDASAGGALPALNGIPPLLRWMLLQSRSPTELQLSLNRAAALYRLRADSMADVLRAMLPVFGSIGIGGSITAIYVLMMFVPVIEMIVRLTG